MTSVKRKRVKFSGLFLRKSCNFIGGSSQGLMAAPGMLQTPWYSNDHLSNQNLSETTQSLERFLKNNIFPYSVKVVPGKMRKTHRKLKRLPILAMIPKRITSNMGNPKFWLRGGQRLKLRQKSDGCPLRFWPLERRDGTVNSFHATWTRC